MNPLVGLAEAELETNRLKLRPLTLRDLEDYHEYTSDDTLLQYDYPAHLSLDDSLSALVLVNLAQPIGKYGIEFKDNGKLIGNISVRYDESTNSLEMGYTVHRDYNGLGVASEACQAVTEMVRSINIERLTAKVDSRNTPSIKIMAKLGMKEVNRCQELNDRGEFITSIYYELMVD